MLDCITRLSRLFSSHSVTSKTEGRMLSGVIWLTLVAFCWAEKNDAGFEYEASQGVNSIGYTVLYGDETISVINQAVTDIEKQTALKPKVRLNDGIKPLPAIDVKCFMSVDRYCSKEMAHMKGVLIEAIRDDCAKCETEDKSKAGRIIAALMAHDPVAWKTFLTRYDGLGKVERILG